MDREKVRSTGGQLVGSFGEYELWDRKPGYSPDWMNLCVLRPGGPKRKGGPTCWQFGWSREERRFSRVKDHRRLKNYNEALLEQIRQHLLAEFPVYDWTEEA